jgi:hypothetical protein
MANRDKILEDIKTDQFDFYKSSDEIKELVLNDLEICLELLKVYKLGPFEFENLHADIRDNKEFVLEYLSNDGYRFDSISDRLKSDRDVCLIAALSTNGGILSRVDKSLFKDVLFLKLSLKTIKTSIIEGDYYFDLWEIIYKNSDIFKKTIIRLEILFKYHRLLKILIWVSMGTTSLYLAYKLIIEIYNGSKVAGNILAFTLEIGFIIPLLVVWFLNYILFCFIPWKIISRTINKEFREKYEWDGL